MWPMEQVEGPGVLGVGQVDRAVTPKSRAQIRIGGRERAMAVLNALQLPFALPLDLTTRSPVV